MTNMIFLKMDKGHFPFSDPHVGPCYLCHGKVLFGSGLNLENLFAPGLNLEKSSPQNLFSDTYNYNNHAKKLHFMKKLLFSLSVPMNENVMK